MVSLAAFIDHTLLRPEATDAEVAALVAEGASLGCHSVCISPARVPAAARAAGQVGPSAPVICTVIGFPSGVAAAKAREAEWTLDAGAFEFDMVIDRGAVAAADWKAVGRDILAVRNVLPRPLVLKVILETGALTADAIVAACETAVGAGADFVKTSTGFGPGGATTETVALMRATVGPDIGVKASGGIRDAATARAMLEAGATRLGTSNTVAILTETDPEAPDDY
jgi:deoxyribose-phosphate aldolase